MPEIQPTQAVSFSAMDDHPLIGVILEENGQQVVRYFADESAADAAEREDATQAALSAIGAWSDLDWDQTVAELDRIRHESQPTPPITDL